MRQNNAISHQDTLDIELGEYVNRWTCDGLKGKAMMGQSNRNLGFGRSLLTLLFSVLILTVLFGSLSREMEAEPVLLSFPKTSGEKNFADLLDYQIGVPVCEQTKNLLHDLNPDFEDGIGCGNHWCCCTVTCTCQGFQPGYGNSSTSARIFAGDVRDERCMLFTPSYEWVLVEPGRYYDYSAWVRSDLLQGDAYLSVTFWDSARDYAGEGRTTPVTGYQDWIKVTGSVQAPPNAKYARVEATLPANSRGFVWFDDIFVGLATCLDISKSDDPTLVEHGQLLTYTIVYTNTGREKATNVQLIETYDSYVDFELAQPPPFAGTTIWMTPTLSPGNSSSITVVVRVEDDTGERAYLFNAVQIHSGETLEKPVYASISTTVEGNGCDIVPYIPNANKSGAPGYPTDYALTLQNAGNYNGQADLTAVSTRGWDVIITPPPPYTLLSGSSKEVIVSSVVPRCELSGTIGVTLITTTLVCGPPCNKTVTKTDRVTTTVVQQIGVDIEPDTSKPPPATGSSVTFTHTVANTGNWADTIELSSDFPPGFTVTIEPTRLENLGACQSAPITVTVDGLTQGSELTGTIRAKSMSAPNEFAEVIDEIRPRRTHLPLVLKGHCYCAPNQVANSCFVSPCDLALSWEKEGSIRKEVVEAGEDNPFGCCAARLGDPAYDNNSGEIPVNDRATIYQTVTVPNTSSPSLEFVYAMYSYHIMKGGITGRLFDTFEVAIDDLNSPKFQTGNPEGMVPNDCRPEPWQSGIQSQSLDLKNYAGKTITLYFSVWNRIHGKCNTWVYIDRVRIVP